MNFKLQTLTAVNSLLKRTLPSSVTALILRRLCHKKNITYLDLGGRSALEGYLVIHLSPVEPYGLPIQPSKTQKLIENSDNSLYLVWRNLTHASITLSYDVRRGIPLPNNSLNGINMSHFLEHLNLNDGKMLLQECCRVLRPRGVIRISCPDLSKYATAYLNNDIQFFETVGKLPYCNYPKMATSGAIFAGKAYDNHNGHLWFYDAETVIALLKEVGIIAAKETSLHQSCLPSIEEIEPLYREVESFYVEATK